MSDLALIREKEWEKYKKQITLQFKKRYSEAKGLKKLITPKTPCFDIHTKIMFNQGFDYGYLLAKKQELKFWRKQNK